MWEEIQNATVSVAGDPQVGIPSTYWEISGSFFFKDKEEREWQREQIESAFGDIAGEPATCLFSDEYPKDPIEQ